MFKNLRAALLSRPSHSTIPRAESSARNGLLSSSKLTLLSSAPITRLGPSGLFTITQCHRVANRMMKLSVHAHYYEYGITEEKSVYTHYDFSSIKFRLNKIRHILFFKILK